MRMLFLKIIGIFFVLCLSNSLWGQTSTFFIGIGGFAKHSFPNQDVAQNTSILGYSNVESKTLLLEPGYELVAGIKFNNRFDLLVGINSTSSNLKSSPYYYELNFRRINFPIQFRYHFLSNEVRSNFAAIGLSFGRIIQQELSRDRSVWQHSYLEDLNGHSPLSLELGIGRSCKITEKSNLIINPFLNYELSKNKILKDFFAPFGLGIKLSYELNCI